MKLLLDQDIYQITAKFLLEQGHDILLASELGLEEASDQKLLNTAQKKGRILVTRDRDYGNLVFVKGMGTGVIYLRILPKNLNLIHQELSRVLQIYSQKELVGGFVVIQAGGHRFRRQIS
ncbi:UNVERIFIED_CONTAM: hypothetical protein BEN50_07405 [Euhalothece sp. KZN 001]